MAIIFKCPLMPRISVPGHRHVFVYPGLWMMEYGGCLFANPEWICPWNKTAADATCFGDVDWTKDVSFYLQLRSRGRVLCIVTKCEMFELQEMNAVPLRPVARSTA
jgi:hypothetical protein